MGITMGTKRERPVLLVWLGHTGVCWCRGIGLGITMDTKRERPVLLVWVGASGGVLLALVAQAGSRSGGKALVRQA